MTLRIEPRRLRWASPEVLITLVALAAALAMLFGTADGTAGAAEEGMEGIYSEAVLSASAAARNQVVQAHVIAAAESARLATAAELDDSLRQVSEALSELETRLIDLEGSAGRTPLVASGWIDFSDAVGEAVDAIRSGRLEEARNTIDNDLELSYRSLVTSIVEIRDARMLGLQLAQDNAGRVANAARFAVAFLIPLTAVLAFRRSLHRRQRQTRLEQEVESQRAATRAKDEAIANLSHELRTPLTSIYGFAITMLDDNAMSSESRESAQVIAGEAADLSRMVDDLLVAAKSDNEALAFRQEAVDPAIEVQKTLDSLIQGVVVHTMIDEAEVSADRVRFRQVLRNLMANAVKHGEPPFAIRGRTENGEYVLEIIDSGSGVSAEVAPRIFERYVHRGLAPLVTGSVGLGLSIARLLVEGMGGNLSYRRVKDLTIFEIRLPLIRAEEAVLSPPLVSAV